MELQKQWAIYRANAYPGELPKGLEDHLRQTFFGGCLVALEAAVHVSTTGTDEEGEAAFGNLMNEARDLCEARVRELRSKL